MSGNHAELFEHAYHPDRDGCDCVRLGRMDDDECVHDDPCWVSREAYEATLSRPVATDEARLLRLAQACRLLRDTTSEGSYVHNVVSAALRDTGIPDPPDEDHP